MRNEPAVTVIMPVHNRERFVAEALDSLLAQTFEDFLVILVDDASTDGTAQILRGYSDRRVRILLNPDRLGVAGARNRALAVTDTRYVAFLDSDDVALPRRLEIQMAFLRAHDDVQLVASRVAVIDEGGSPTGTVWGHDAGDDAIPSSMLFTNSLATSTIVVERNLLREERFDASLNPGEDYDMWLRLLDRGRAACLPDVLVRYRVHPGSLMHTAGAAEECLQRIARARLTRLGIAPTTAELETHRDLGSGRPRGTARDLAAVGRWLEKLDHANAAVHLYRSDVFRGVLARHWLAACDAAARGGAWDAWPLIVQSRFTRRSFVSSHARRPWLALPWRTVRGLVRRRWPAFGPAVRALGRSR